MFKLQIPRAQLVAALRFAAVGDIRYYLNGVHVEVHANVAYLVGTDGHTMAIARLQRDAGSIMQGQGSAIIPAEGFHGIKLAKRGNLDIVLEVTAAEDPSAPAHFAVRDGDRTLCGRAIDGKFPDWRRVIPARVSGRPSQLDPAYVTRCGKAAQDLGNRKGLIAIAHNGPTEGQDPPQYGAALVEFPGADFLAVVMPVRAEIPAAYPPAWVAEISAAVGRLELAEALAEAFPDPVAAFIDAHPEIAAANQASAESQGFAIERIAA